MSMTLTDKIKDDYGTVKRFCAKNNINYNTYKQVVYLGATSAPIAKILIKHKYIKSADELKKAS